MSGVNLVIEAAEQLDNKVTACSPISIEVPLNNTPYASYGCEFAKGESIMPGFLWRAVPDVPLPIAVAGYIEASQVPNQTVAALQERIAELEAELQASQKSSALAHKHKRKTSSEKPS